MYKVDYFLLVNNQVFFVNSSSRYEKIPKKIWLSLEGMDRELAEANIMSFLSYFNEAEDYLDVANDKSVTFQDIVIFMTRFRNQLEQACVEFNVEYNV